MNKKQNIRATLKDIGLKPKISLIKRIKGSRGKTYMVHTSSKKAITHLRTEEFIVSGVGNVLVVS